MSSFKKMCIGDFLGCEHKLNKCLLFIARFEMEAWPTRFLSDCKRFSFLFFFIVLHSVYCSNEECEMTRQHIYSHFCAFIYRFSGLNLSVCQASTITTLSFTCWKWMPFFLDRCTNKRGFGKWKKCHVVFEALKHEAPKVIISLFPY